MTLGYLFIPFCFMTTCLLLLSLVWFPKLRIYLSQLILTYDVNKNNFLAWRTSMPFI